MRNWREAYYVSGFLEVSFSFFFVSCGHGFGSVFGTDQLQANGADDSAIRRLGDQLCLSIIAGLRFQVLFVIIFSDI